MIAHRSSSSSKRSSSLLWIASGLVFVVACSNQITYSRIGVELPDSGPGIGGRGGSGAGGRSDGGSSAGGADAGGDVPIGSGGMIGTADAGTGGSGAGGTGTGGTGTGDAGMGTGGAGMGGMGTGGAGMGGMGTGGAGMGGTGVGGAGGGPLIDNAQFNFEASAQGWMADPAFTAPARVTTQRFAGAASLGATLTYAPTAAPVPQDLWLLPAAGTGPVAGNLITFHVFLPTNAGGVIAFMQPYIQDAPLTFTGAYTPATMLIFGGWNTITLPVPASAVSPIFKIGVQFGPAGTVAFSGTVYVDSIGW